MMNIEIKTQKDFLRDSPSFPQATSQTWQNRHMHIVLTTGLKAGTYLTTAICISVERIRSLVYSILERLYALLNKLRGTSISTPNTPPLESLSQKIRNVTQRFITVQSRKIHQYIREKPYKAAMIGIVLTVGGWTLYANYQHNNIGKSTEFNVPQGARQALERLMPKIVRATRHPEIEWIKEGNNYVFSLTSYPNIIFKLMPIKNAKFHWKDTPDRIMERRFTNMQKGQEICAEHNLDLLRIPRATMFQLQSQGKQIPIIAEERMPLDSEAGDWLCVDSSLLTRTVKQLATFIAKTGFSDVDYRNIPLLKDKPNTNRRVALIDLEHMEDSYRGIFGSSPTRGLIGCLRNEEHIKAAAKEAARYGVKFRFRHVVGGRGVVVDLQET